MNHCLSNLHNGDESITLPNGRIIQQCYRLSLRIELKWIGRKSIKSGSSSMSKSDGGCSALPVFSRLISFFNTTPATREWIAQEKCCHSVFSSFTLTVAVHFCGQSKYLRKPIQPHTLIYIYISEMVQFERSSYTKTYRYRDRFAFVFICS